LETIASFAPASLKTLELINGRDAFGSIAGLADAAPQLISLTFRNCGMGSILSFLFDFFSKKKV